MIIYIYIYITRQLGRPRSPVDRFRKCEMRNEKELKKKINTPPPPPPPDFFCTPIFFGNVGNSMKREENMKYLRKKYFNLIFFNI